MSEIRFTPGPWEAVDNDVYFEIRAEIEGISRRLGDVCASMHCFDDGNHSNEGVARANVDLIAASPELYEAIEVILNDLERGFAPNLHIPRARAALAKARGE